MNEDRTLESVGAPSNDEYTILVALGNPDHVPQLLRTASDLAAAAGGSIHVVSVVAKDYDSPFGIFDDETIKAEFAADRRAVLDAAIDAGDQLDVSVTGEVVVDRSVSRGVIRTANDVDAGAILVGWTGPAWRPRAVLGSSVDAILERAPVDVYVERIGATADGVDRVLVPVAGGPHVDLAVTAGHAIAAANDAELTILSVTARDESGEATALESATANESVEEAEAALPSHSDVAVESRIVANDDVVDAIVAVADDHDVIVMGAARGGHLRARLVGSIPRAVTDRTDRTILLARRWTGVSRVVQWLGRFRRR